MEGVTWNLQRGELRVKMTNQISRLQRSADGRREHEAVLFPSLADELLFLPLAIAMPAEDRDGKTRQWDRAPTVALQFGA